ncbi:DUF1027 domain-containing protein, partial [Lactobacillus sp. XV13L]|nr:DUF1027 domain-containing protein [Lactobacillus sp. XV13L]
FIVGDVSSAHLRLKGFYKDAVRTAIDRKQQTIADYVMEYCNPGSPYFVLELLNPVHHYHASSRNRYRRNPHGKRPDTTFKRYRVHQTNFKKRASVAEKKETRNHHSFVIKKRKGSS